MHDESRLLQAVLDTTGCLVSILDPAGRILAFNHACEQLTGYREAEMLGRSLIEALVPPDEWAGVEAMAARLLAGERQLTHQNHWVGRTGERFLIAWSNAVITGDAGRAERLVATGLDITPLAEAREAAARGEARYRDLVDHMPDGLVLIQDGRLVFANPQAAAQMGFDDAARIVGLAREQLASESGLPVLLAHDAAVGAGRRTRPTVVRMRRVDGRPLDLEIHATPTTWQGRPAIQSVGRDVTERERERRLRTSFDQLASHLLAGRALGATLTTLVEDVVTTLDLVGAAIWFHGRDQAKRYAAGAGEAELLRRARAGGPAGARTAPGVQAVLDVPIEVNDVEIGMMSWYLPAADDGLRELATTTARRIALAHQLAQRQALLQLLESALAGTATPVMITDAMGTIVWANAALCWLTGYPREALVGAPPQRLLAPGQAPGPLQELYEAIRQARACKVVLQLARPDGRTRSVTLACSPVLDEDGEASHFLSLFDEGSGEL